MGQVTRLVCQDEASFQLQTVCQSCQYIINSTGQPAYYTGFWHLIDSIVYQIVSRRFYYCRNLSEEVVGSGWSYDWLVMVDEDNELDDKFDSRSWSVPVAPVVVAVVAVGS